MPHNLCAACTPHSTHSNSTHFGVTRLNRTCSALTAKFQLVVATPCSTSHDLPRVSQLSFSNRLSLAVHSEMPCDACYAFTIEWPRLFIIKVPGTRKKSSLTVNPLILATIFNSYLQ